MVQKLQQQAGVKATLQEQLEMGEEPDGVWYQKLDDNIFEGDGSDIRRRIGKTGGDIGFKD